MDGDGKRGLVGQDLAERRTGDPDGADPMAPLTRRAPPETGPRPEAEAAPPQGDPRPAPTTAPGTASTPDAPPERVRGPLDPPARRRIYPFVIFGVVLLAAAAGGTAWWLHARHYASTDDAFIDAYTSSVAPQAGGRVIAIHGDDNQLVHQGDLLVEIDPRDATIKLEQAEAQRGNADAQLEQAQAQLTVQQAALDQAEANVRVAEADLFQAQQDLNRFKAIDPHAVTRQQVDNASAAQRSAQAKLDANRQAVAGAAAQVKSAQAQVDMQQASVKLAEVQVDQARLQLSYMHVLAPVDGRITQRSVHVGNYVSTGAPMMSIVPTKVFVTANFKETQLDHMRPGEPVDIDVDAYPEVTLHGTVDSIQSGTGSVFSTLPAENATGNYVKVVQRVPVKIVFDDPRAADYPLSPGMSVVPTVTVR